MRGARPPSADQRRERRCLTLLVCLAAVLVCSTLASVYEFERDRRGRTRPGGARGWEPAAAAAGPSPRLFLGIMTREGWDGYVRREAMRGSGAVPVTAAEVRRWERETGIAFRFVVGGASGPPAAAGRRAGAGAVTRETAPEEIIAREEQEYGEGIFLKLNEFLQSANPLTDDYKSLPLKTYSYFSAVTRMYPDVAYIAKVDDDVLVKPFNLLAATHDYEAGRYDYIR